MNDRKIPCEEPQDCGWTCNVNHLCDECIIQDRINESQIELIRKHAESTKNLRETIDMFKGFVQSYQQDIRDIFEKFDEYSAIKDDAFYKDLRAKYYVKIGKK